MCDAGIPASPVADLPASNLTDYKSWGKQEGLPLKAGGNTTDMGESAVMDVFHKETGHTFQILVQSFEPVSGGGGGGGGVCVANCISQSLRSIVEQQGNHSGRYWMLVSRVFNLFEQNFGLAYGMPLLKCSMARHVRYQ